MANAADVERLRAGIAKLKVAVIDAEIMRFTGLLPDGVIGTERVQRYGMILDKDRIIAFLPTVTRHLADMTGAPSSSIQWAEVTAAQKKLATIPAEKFPKGVIEFYRSNKLPARITIQYLFEANLFEAGPIAAGIKPIEVIGVRTFSGYGDTFSIVEPKESITLQEAVSLVSAATSRPAATLAGPEVDSWIVSLSAATRADLSAARELTLRMFGSAKPKTGVEYDSYLSCIGLILQKTTASISVEDVSRLETKPAAYQLLVPPRFGDPRTVAEIRRTLVTTLFAEHLYSEAIRELGFSSVNETARLATTKPEVSLLSSNSNACKTLPVHARFK